MRFLAHQSFEAGVFVAAPWFFHSPRRFQFATDAETFGQGGRPTG